MKAIGGYFELANREEGRGLPSKGFLLNTGRNALEFLLRSIGVVKRLYIPYYTCEAIFEPIEKLQIPWSFYHIDENLEMSDTISPKKEEYIIVNNYFGIKDYYIEKLVEHYGEHIILDYAQALFAKPFYKAKAFYSVRKFVGVADGGIAFTGCDSANRLQIPEIECTSSHDSHLYTRKYLGAELGFKEFQENEKRLSNQPIRLMSAKTIDILNHIDYVNVVTKRRMNFSFLHDSLKDFNLLSIPNNDTFICPMAYPFLIREGTNLRKVLIDKKVFVAKYWPNISYHPLFHTEDDLADNLVALPCDQRYGMDEMNQIITIILNFLN